MVQLTYALSGKSFERRKIQVIPVCYFYAMHDDFLLRRTTTNEQDFQHLVSCLDHELWVELKEDQATYDGFNKVPDIDTAVIVSSGGQAVACGCFKRHDELTVEIKRMFVKKAWRGKGLSKAVLHELERWAVERGFRFALLETSIRFETAKNLYQSNGYFIIPNYPPYEGLAESVCMKKVLDTAIKNH